MARDILIVDDEPLIRKTVAGILEDGGYAPRDASDGTTAIEAIDSGPPPALIILDVWLEGSQLDGMDVLEAVTHRHPEVPVIMISGHGTIDTAVAAIKKGAYEFIEKPLDSDRLLLSVTRALEAAELKREVAELKLRAGETRELIGTSSGDQANPRGCRTRRTDRPTSLHHWPRRGRKGNRRAPYSQPVATVQGAICRGQRRHDAPRPRGA